MTAPRHILGIDFGTSNTAAVLRWPDGRLRPLLFDGAPLLPSAVLLDDDGVLVAGREAVHGRRARPEAYEPNPKRHVDRCFLVVTGRLPSRWWVTPVRAIACSTDSGLNWGYAE